MRKPGIHRSRVFLVAYSADALVVERKTIAYDAYYDNRSPLIDDDRYRKDRKIRVLVGEIYDSSASMQQHFINFYNRRGAYVRGRAVHSDGRIIET